MHEGRRILNQIEKNQFKVKRLEEKKQQLKKPHIKSTNYDKEMVTGGIRVTTEDILADLIDDKDAIDREIERITKLNADIIKTIFKLDEPKHAILLYKKYVEGCRQKEIAIDLDCSKSSVNRLHNLALDDFLEAWGG